MEPEETSPTPEQADKFESLKRVIPLSKYLALALFVVLPFMGFWLGEEYGGGTTYVGDSPPVIQDESFTQLQRHTDTGSEIFGNFELCTDEQTIYRTTDFLTDQNILSIAGVYEAKDHTLMPIDPHPCLVWEGKKTCHLGSIVLSEPIAQATSGDMVVVTGTLGLLQSIKSDESSSYDEQYSLEVESHVVYTAADIISKEEARSTCLVQLIQEQQHVDALCDKYSFNCALKNLQTFEPYTQQQWYGMNTRFSPAGTWVIGIPVGSNYKLSSTFERVRDNRMDLQYTCMIDARTGVLVESNSCGNDWGCSMCE